MTATTATIETPILTQVDKPADLQVVNMSKHFDHLIALDNVSLHLKPGTFHALLGENGAGKSTLVKCIMGFYHPTHGEILVNNQLQIR